MDLINIIKIEYTNIFLNKWEKIVIMMIYVNIHGKSVKRPGKENAQLIPHCQT